MPLFSYRATKPTGEQVAGERQAETREEIISMLHEQGLIVISIEQKIGFSFDNLGDIQIGGVPLTEKVIFTRQLATMLGAGLPVASALEILVEQTKFSGLKKQLTEVYKDVQSGLPLASSFGKHKAIFDELQLSLIEAGEKSGNLVEIITQIAEDMQKSSQLRGRVRGAMIYPAVILLAIIIVIIVLVVFMIPAVEDLYNDLSNGEAELPLITQALVTISDFFTNPLGLGVTIFVVVASIVGFRTYYNTDSGRKFVDKLLLRLPVFGDLQAKSQVLQMTRLLQMLIKSGIPIIDALKATGRSMGNVHFKLALFYAAQEVAKGQQIAGPLAKNKVVPLIVIKMIATGEETGALEKILGDLARFYEDQVEEITSNLTKLMEPLILLIVGGLVALLAVAVYLPIYNVANIV
ncbi:MAG: Type II secretion system protein F [candidate division WS6 bacterium OLB20]|uniref:Type II secretion system protein F n=1 Tax=candidate division WS6 bacterium OLB20 TaxID=1617426 RepID=A0A136LY52_9BACT|nr:MAG: Type II secretion system protein F [candidate division WS6 bacterium OLB20]